MTNNACAALSHEGFVCTLDAGHEGPHQAWGRHRHRGPHRTWTAGDVDVDALLQSGGSIVLSYDPGQQGAVNEEGYVTQEPYEPFYVAEARDQEGSEIGSGSGISIEAALHGVTRRATTADSLSLTDEPPF